MENDELAQHLESLRREDCYRVDAVLKQSLHETTQRVYFVGDNGAETGPYIRKFIRRDSSMGVAYERIYAVQQSGRRFKYIPDVLECYARNGYLVVVMECVRGETLQDVVYRLDPSLDLAVDIFPRLCDAVSELHDDFDPPIIHRDLKPSNVILSQAGLAIIDFGIAREFKDESDSDTTHFGTRGFAAPEQFGFGQTTVRSDVYSLGMVLYYLLTEAIPDSAMRERGFTDSRIPESLRQVIVRAAAFDPDARYSSVRDLKAAFEQAIASGKPDGAVVSDGRGDAVGARGSAGDSPARPMPKEPHNVVPKPEMRFRLAGEIWNVVLAIFVIAAFFVCGSRAANPTGAMVGNPRAYNFLVAYLYMWPSCISLAFLVSDKRRLKQKFPRLARLRWWQWLAICAGVVVLFAFVVILLERPMGAVAVAS